MTSPTRTLAPAWLTDLLYVLTGTPLLRWLIVHHTVPNGRTWRTVCAHCGTTLWPTACRPNGR